MQVIICMLRGVNVGGHNMVKMQALRELCIALKFRNPQTYVQSGNVIFATSEKNLQAIEKKIDAEFKRSLGFQPQIILRTTEELRDVIRRNPFAKRKGIEANKLLVNFLARDPGEEVRRKVRAFKSEVEEIKVDGRELYIYFPNGMGRPKFSWAALDKILQTPATGRNWNSVTKMLVMAEKIEASECSD
ncbi:MAG TPA: DUF1697 domain-containing protein [Candidatus Acidoferrum sp.]